jgi:hypothetical protein
MVGKTLIRWNRERLQVVAPQYSSPPDGKYAAVAVHRSSTAHDQKKICEYVSISKPLVGFQHVRNKITHLLVSLQNCTLANMLLSLLLTIVGLAVAIPVAEMDGRSDLKPRCKNGEISVRKEWSVKPSTPEFLQWSNDISGAN